MDIDPPFVVANPAHPSLDDALGRFAAELGAEHHGRGATRLPARVRRLMAHGPGIAAAAVVDGEVIGLARIDLSSPAAPELLVAVLPRWRARGVAAALGATVVARAADAGVERIVVHAGDRSGRLRSLASAGGFRLVDAGGGRLDLIRTAPPVCRSA